MNLLMRLCTTAFLSAISAAALAQSSAEARISNVTLQLIDLDLTDGIAPSLTFNTGINGTLAGWDIYDEHTGLLYSDSKTTSAPLGPVTAEQSIDNLPHTRSDVSAGISGINFTDKELWARASMSDTLGTNTTSAYVTSGNVWFVLSPNTQVIFSADLSVRSSAGPVAGPRLFAIANSSATMGLYSSRENVWQSTPLYHNAVFGQDRGPGWDRTYSLSFSNATASEGAYALGLNVGASAYTSAVIPAPVPEPASIAMLLAGLGVVAVRTRKSSRLSGPA
jgi:hypothetical protein